MLQHMEKEIGGRKLVLEVGEVAKQANGAALVWYGETVVLVTAAMAPEIKDRGLSGFGMKVGPKGVGEIF